MLPTIRTPHSHKVFKLGSNSTRITSPKIITLCPHLTPQPKPDSSRVEIRLKVRHQIFERLIYQSSPPTQYRQVGPITESSSFIDPFCKHCYNRRLQLIRDTGVSEVEGKQILKTLQNFVSNKIRQYVGFSFDGEDYIKVVPLRYSMKLTGDRDCFNEEEYVSWVRDMSFDEVGRVNGPIPADIKAVEALEKVEEFVGDENCVVCLEELKCSSDCFVLRRLPCLHVFHEGCIVKWLGCSYVCPLCRYELPKADSIN